ncbi:hypothetical protein [Chamaesiphon minutus]|nr:hypothetical protein [Chamaesiphon minutus]
MVRRSGGETGCRSSLLGRSIHGKAANISDLDIGRQECKNPRWDLLQIV